MTKATICIGFSKDLGRQAELATELLEQFVVAGSQIDTIFDGLGLILAGEIPPASLNTLKQQAAQQNLTLTARS